MKLRDLAGNEYDVPDEVAERYQISPDQVREIQRRHRRDVEETRESRTSPNDDEEQDHGDPDQGR